MNKPARLHAISDNPATNTGLGLVEISSQRAQTPEELQQTLENLSPDIGIVIITENLAAKSAHVIQKYREKRKLPLITTIPEPRRHPQ